MRRTQENVLTRVTSILQAPLAPTLALWFVIATYCITFGALSILQHDSFGTSIYDLGNVDQAVWNTLHGRILQFTTQPHMGDIRLSMHIEPILLPVSLLYLIYSSPKTLLILQTVAIGLGAWPLFLIAKLKLKAAWPAVAFALAYLLLPALEAANLFEFHAVVMAPLFLLFTFYFMERTSGQQPLVKYFPAVAFALLAMSCKEDIPLLIVMMGLYFAVISRKWKAGLLLMVLGGVWFYVAIYVVFPAARQGQGSPFMYYYGDFGDNPISIVLTLVTNPRLTSETLLTRDNLQYMTGLLFPFGFLPVFGLPTLLIAAPSIGINLLSSFPLMHELEAKQYAVPIVPFVALGAVYGALHLSRWIRKGRTVAYSLSLLVLVCSFTYHYFRGFSPLSRAYEPPSVTAHHALASEFIQEIPPDAPLIAQDRLFPHVSQRERAYYVWTPGTDADYILLDVSHPTFVNTDNVHQWLKDRVTQQDEFGLVRAQDGYILLQRGAERMNLPDEFYSYVQAGEDAHVAYPMRVDFGDELGFLGFDIHYDRDREVTFELYWQALRPVERDYSVQLHLVDAAGDTVASTSTPQPALVWYPTSRWQPDQKIKVTANTLPWSTENMESYGIALGVSYDDPSSDAPVSLLPRVKAAPYSARLLSNGSLLELARFEKRWGMPYAVMEPRKLAPPMVDHELGANFGNLAKLTGFSISPVPLEAEQPVQIELVWQALSPMPESFTVFVHLIESGGKIWGQQDSLPQQGTLPTTGWVPGEFIRDTHSIQIPKDAPIDSLEVAIGLYRVDTGDRVMVIDDGGGIIADHVTVVTH